MLVIMSMRVSIINDVKGVLNKLLEALDPKGRAGIGYVATYHKSEGILQRYATQKISTKYRVWKRRNGKAEMSPDTS